MATPRARVLTSLFLALATACGGATTGTPGGGGGSSSGGTTDVGPAITTQPAGQIVNAGQTATFGVVATGSPAPTFQWRRNGVDLAGATAASYTTPATAADDDGAQFTVRVSNRAGDVVSAAATLTVRTAPVIDVQPQAQTVTEGQAATFSVTAHGTAPLAYQWRKGGAEIAGATAASYTTPATTLADSGAQLTVVVSNAAGTVTSAAATLTVNPGSMGTAPAITTQPASQTVNAGQTATFAVVATGSPAPSYQWRRNGTAITGATSASYTTPATVAGDSGAVFTVVVSNTAGTVTSAGATLTVRTAPAITTHPASVTVTAGQTATFTVVATGSPAPTYQWQRNGTAITGATSASYTTPATTTADSGATFRVVVTNAAGTVTSSAATLTVTSAAAFAVDVTRPPTSRASGPLAISSYIYGINPYDGDIDRRTKWGLFRSGGNSFTTWNWIANYHNTGMDYCFGAYDGGAVGGDVAWVGDAAPKGIAALLTTAIVDYVAANRRNETWPACDSAYGTNVNGIGFAPSSWFVSNVQKKPAAAGALCLYPGPAGQTGSCALDPNAATIYQDEYVNYLKHWYADGAGATVFVELDNEPNYWSGTHPEVWSSNNIYYDDIVNRDRAAATAYRAVWPAARLFGPVVAQDGIVYAHDYSRTDEFLDYYLPRMSGLLDVLDVHYYNSGGDAATCLQSPRAFWDPTYTVPNDQDGMDYVVRDWGNTAWTHRQIITRLQDKIAAAGMSPVPGLAITEYDAGCEAAIAGGIAQADTLGVFGKYGVYAATAWLNARPNSGGTPDPTRDYAGVAFDLFRNYDGSGAVVGDLAVQATAPSVTDFSLYAFAHAGDTTKLELVALNKTSRSQTAHLTVATAFAFTRATLYRLAQAASGANVAVSPVGGTAPAVSCAAGTCTLDVVLPPLSGTTIVLR